MSSVEARQAHEPPGRGPLGLFLRLPATISDHDQFRKQAEECCQLAAIARAVHTERARHLGDGFPRIDPVECLPTLVGRGLLPACARAPWGALAGRSAPSSIASTISSSLSVDVAGDLPPIRFFRRQQELPSLPVVPGFAGHPPAFQAGFVFLGSWVLYGAHERRLVVITL